MTAEHYKEAAEILRSVQWSMTLPDGHEVTPEAAAAERLVRGHWYTAREIRENTDPNEVAVLADWLDLTIPLTIAATCGPRVAESVARYRFPEIPEGTFFRPSIPELIEEMGAAIFR